MSVNVERAAWRCHACGIRGGLVGLRRACGRQVDSPRSTRWLLAGLASVGAIDGPDPLELIPAAAIADLRARTGRHLLDGPLRRNLRRLVAAIVDRMTEAEHTAEVRFTATDAAERGCNSFLWRDLLPLTRWLGLDVVIGQSGRNLATLGAGRGKNGRLAATTLTLRPDSAYLFRRDEVGTSETSKRYARTRAEATLTAAAAVAAPLDGLDGLARRPAMATLLADLASFSLPHDVDEGALHAADRLTSELVAAHGSSIRRTIRTAESAGWVVVTRLGRSGMVTLTTAGAEVLARDAAAGAARLRERAAEVRARWLDLQERHREHRARAAQDRRARWLAEHCPYVPHAPGIVRHAITGELVPLHDLRGAAA